MIAIIAARSRNNVIGKDGRIPWRIRGEQKQFRELTVGNAVIMGRRTYEEIGRPLPDRLNIVVSQTRCFSAPNLVTVGTLREAIRLAGERDCYVSGGSSLFREALPLADVMYITEIDTDIPDGDTFFPKFDRNDFDVEAGESGGDELRFVRYTYKRKRI